MKVWAVIIIQTFLVSISFISYFFYPWDNLAKGGYQIVNILYYSPAFTTVIILIVAFINLRK